MRAECEILWKSPGSCRWSYYTGAMRVLVVEDERDLASALKTNLERHGFVVDLAFDADEGGRLASVYPYEAMVLDRTMPGEDGVALCGRLRAQGFAGGILMLTARDALDDRVEGLNAGADDYLVKPFAFKELVARLHAVARRHTSSRTSVLSVRDVTIRLDEAIVERGGQPIALNRKEYLLLVYFMRHPGRLITREQIIDAAWDAESEASDETVRAQVKNLRKKLETVGSRPLIRTVHGMGYRLEP
ncbi:Transcriptional regulatory protein QseB [compost metagenome]